MVPFAPIGQDMTTKNERIDVNWVMSKILKKNHPKPVPISEKRPRQNFA